MIIYVAFVLSKQAQRLHRQKKLQKTTFFFGFKPTCSNLANLAKWLVSNIATGLSCT